MQYRIESWTAVEEENPQTYPSLLAVRNEVKSLREMQPENIYQIEAVEQDYEVECYFCGNKERVSVAQDKWIPSFWHNEFVVEQGPACPECSKRLKKDSNDEYFLPLGG